MLINMDLLYFLTLLTLIVPCLSASFDNDWYIPENKTDFPKNIIVKEFTEQWTTLEYNRYMKPIKVGFLKPPETAFIQMTITAMSPPTETGHVKHSRSFFGFQVNTDNGLREGIFSFGKDNLNGTSVFTIWSIPNPIPTSYQDEKILCYAFQSEMSLEVELIHNVMQQFWCLNESPEEKVHFGRGKSALMEATISDYAVYEKSDDQPEYHVVPVSFYIKKDWDFLYPGLFWKFPAQDICFPAKTRPETQTEQDAAAATVEEVIDVKKCVTIFFTISSIVVVCGTLGTVTTVLILRYREQKRYYAQQQTNN